MSAQVQVIFNFVASGTTHNRPHMWNGSDVTDQQWPLDYAKDLVVYRHI